MEIYVIYVLSDYACAIGVTTDEKTAKKYAEEIHARTKNHTWTDKIKVDKKLTKLDCD